VHVLTEGFLLFLFRRDDTTGGLEQLLSQATSISFESICYIDKDLYGNIFLEVNGTVVDLKDYILRNNLATYSCSFETGIASLVQKIVCFFFFIRLIFWFRHFIFFVLSNKWLWWYY
jgi:protein associated with RNAse G/E